MATVCLWPSVAVDAGHQPKSLGAHSWGQVLPPQMQSAVLLGQDLTLLTEGGRAGGSSDEVRACDWRWAVRSMSRLRFICRLQRR